MLNPLEHGARCVITTRDMRIVAGWFRGIEVAHGDRAILVEAPGSSHTIPVESVLSTSGPQSPDRLRPTQSTELRKETAMFSNLHVGNLTFDTTTTDLQTLFAQHGEVIKTQVVTDLHSGRSRGFGFVEMATPEEAKISISALDGHNVDGRDITVAIAKPRSR